MKKYYSRSNKFIDEYNKQNTKQTDGLTKIKDNMIQ